MFVKMLPMINSIGHTVSLNLKFVFRKLKRQINLKSRKSCRDNYQIIFELKRWRKTTKTQKVEEECWKIEGASIA